MPASRYRPRGKGFGHFIDRSALHSRVQPRRSFQKPPTLWPLVDALFRRPSRRIGDEVRANVTWMNERLLPADRKPRAEGGDARRPGVPESWRPAAPPAARLSGFRPAPPPSPDTRRAVPLMPLRRRPPHAHHCFATILALVSLFTEPGADLLRHELVVARAGTALDDRRRPGLADTLDGHQLLHPGAMAGDPSRAGAGPVDGSVAPQAARTSGNRTWCRRP